MAHRNPIRPSIQSWSPQPGAAEVTRPERKVNWKMWGFPYYHFDNSKENNLFEFMSIIMIHAKIKLKINKLKLVVGFVLSWKWSSLCCKKCDNLFTMFTMYIYVMKEKKKKKTE